MNPIWEQPLKPGKVMRLIAVFLGLVALAAQPASAESSPSLWSLERQLAFLVAGTTGDVGIAALDLHNGTSVSIRGDEPFPMASTVKVAVAATYLAQVDHGRRSLDDTIAGQSATRLIEAMLIRSDNHATDLLLKNLGGPATVQQWLDWNGFKGIRIDRTIGQLLRDRRDLHDARDTSTPHAMIDLLRRIDGGGVLKPASRTYLLGTMSRCTTGRNRIKAMLPLGTRVEHKTGTLTGLTDDVGFITMPDGRRIAVAVFARGGNNRSRTIAEAARAIYDGFASALTRPFTTGLYSR
jgi:beta-lactamase class A